MQLRRAGFTLIELMFALSLLGLVATSVATLLQRTQDNLVVTMQALDLETSGGGTIRALRETLRGAALQSIDPRVDAPLTSSAIEFQRDPDGDGTWNSTERIEWRLSPAELDDGLDNNGNGLVDEGEIVWIESVGLPSQRDHILSTNVPKLFLGEQLNGADDNDNGLIDEPGLCFSFTGETMRIQISFECPNSKGNALGTSFGASLHLRN